MKVKETSLNIKLIHLDISSLYYIKNTSIGVIIAIINHDLVELPSFFIALAMACVSRLSITEKVIFESKPRFKLSFKWKNWPRNIFLSLIFFKVI